TSVPRTVEHHHAVPAVVDLSPLPFAMVVEHFLPLSPLARGSRNVSAGTPLDRRWFCGGGCGNGVRAEWAQPAQFDVAKQYCCAWLAAMDSLVYGTGSRVGREVDAVRRSDGGRSDACGCARDHFLHMADSIGVVGRRSDQTATIQWHRRPPL